MRRAQQGITLIGFLMVLVLVVFFGFIAMKLFPVYQEYFSVVQAMKGLAHEPDIAQKSPSELREQLFNRFYVSYVTSVERSDVTISRKRGYTINVKYEVRKPLMGNLDLVANFDRTVDLLNPE